MYTHNWKLRLIGNASLSKIIEITSETWISINLLKYNFTSDLIEHFNCKSFHEELYLRQKYSLDPLNVLRQNLFMKYDKLQTHCCAFINYSIFFAKITQFAWAISKNVREIRSSAWNYYTSEAHLELDTRAVRYIRWEKSSREERQERIKPVLDLETQLIVSILKHLVALHC